MAEHRGPDNAYCLLNAAEHRIQEGDFLGGVTVAERALAISEGADHPVILARALGLLGQSHERLGEVEKAVLFYQALAWASKQAGDQHEMERALAEVTRLGQELPEPGPFAPSKGLPTPDQVAQAVAEEKRRVAQVYFQQEKYAEAERLVQESLQTSQRLRDKYGEAAAHSDHANIDLAQGRLEEAWLHLQRSMQIFAVLREETGLEIVRHQLGQLGGALFQQADTLWARGNRAAATQLYRECLEIARIMGDPELHAQLLHTLGTLGIQS